MGKYFSAFPVTTYSNTACIDITTATHLTKQAMLSSSLYYTTDLTEGMRPDHASHKLYNNSYYDWLLYYSNDITDPYYDWMMTQGVFDAYIKEKYGSIAQALEKIVHYEVNWSGDERRITSSEYNTFGISARKYWRPATADAHIYVRKELEHKVNTNVIAKFMVQDPTVFTTGVYASMAVGGNVVLSCEVAFVGTDYIVVRNVEGSIQSGTLVNSVTEVSTTMTGGSITTYVIPADELAYWQKVNAYDYELEANLDKKSIRVLNKKYLQTIESEHRRKLADG